MHRVFTGSPLRFRALSVHTTVLRRRHTHAIPEGPIEGGNMTEAAGISYFRNGQVPLAEHLFGFGDANVTDEGGRRHIFFRFYLAV